MSQVQKKVTIPNDTGLHLRAAGVLVRCAEKFQCDIQVRVGDLEANAKSVLSVMSLAAAKGSELLFKANGPDAKKAVDALVELASSGFGEGRGA